MSDEIQKYYIGSHVYLEALVLNRSTGALVNADVGVDCQIEDPFGTIVTAWAAMTNTATGTYKYITLEIASTHVPGIYRWRPKVKDTGIETIPIEGYFEVMDR